MRYGISQGYLQLVHSYINFVHVSGNNGFSLRNSVK